MYMESLLFTDPCGFVNFWGTKFLFEKLEVIPVPLFLHDSFGSGFSQIFGKFFLRENARQQWRGRGWE